MTAVIEATPSHRAVPADRRVVARPATDAERAGRPVVVRAAAAALAGGAVIAVAAASFGPRLLIADVRAVGIGVGVLAAALALGPLVTGRVGSALLGPVLLAAGVVALPVAAGGFLVGSALLVGAGAVLASVQPAPDGALAVLERGHLPRRVAAAAVDLGLTAVAVVLLLATVLGGPLREQPWLAYVVWAGAWATVTVPAALLAAASPGAWLLAVRVTAPDGSAAAQARVVLRQLLRGVAAVGSALLVASVAVALGVWAAVAVAAAVVAVLVGAARWGRLDGPLGTAARTARVVAP